jgi:hypothetical protein
MLPIAGVAALIGAVVGVTGNLDIPSQDPYVRATEDLAAEILEMPEFEDRFGALDEEDAFRVGFELGAAGIPRLSDAELSEWLSLTRELLGAVDVETCALLIRGTGDANTALDAFKALDLDTYTRYLEIVLQGVRLELTDALGASPPTQADVDAALVLLAEALGPTRSEEVATVFTDPSGASSQQVCAAGRDFYAALATLDEGPRGALIRMVNDLTA